MLVRPADAFPGGPPQPPGFAPAARNLWAPLLCLGPAGDPERTFALIDRMIPFDRNILLHPVLSRSLAALQTRLPPRQSTLIRAAALYSDPTIPWQTQPPDVHFIAVEGRSEQFDYRYDLTANPQPPVNPGDFSGRFSLQPVQMDSDDRLSSVIAGLTGSVAVGGFTPDQALSTAAGILAEIFGTLAPPWDTAPGSFNEHDRAALARVARDMPALSEQIERYLIVDNLLDEFADADGPYVLYNLDVRLRDEALARFPHLRNFYRSLTRLVVGTSTVRDMRGREWLRLAFAGGHFHIIFMLRNGEPAPFDEQLHPAGDALPLAVPTGGQFRTDTSVSVNRFGLSFGLADIRYLVSYRRRDGAIELVGHLREPPVVLAPPIVRSVVLLFAGRFLDTLATGNSRQGVVANLKLLPAPGGGTVIANGIEGEFLYSPALETLARIGDEIGAANNQHVRSDERALLGEFLGAAHRDFVRAQPALSAAPATASVSCR